MMSDKVTNTLDSQNIFFDQFIIISHENLHRYALSLLPPSATHAADDLVQEAYMRVFESIRRGSNPFRLFRVSKPQYVQSRIY